MAVGGSNGWMIKTRRAFLGSAMVPLAEVWHEMYGDGRWDPEKRRLRDG